MNGWSYQIVAHCYDHVEPVRTPYNAWWHYARTFIALLQMWWMKFVLDRIDGTSLYKTSETQSVWSHLNVNIHHSMGTTNSIYYYGTQSVNVQPGRFRIGCNILRFHLYQKLHIKERPLYHYGFSDDCGHYWYHYTVQITFISYIFAFVILRLRLKRKTPF